VIDYDKDYANVWINLQAEVRMLHNYCLKGEWATAENCARECAKYSTQLAEILKEMQDVDD
jgi:hypothetical protein